jgi:hypothetical protein
VRRARASVREARQLLLLPTPPALTGAVAALERAIGCLETLGQSLRSGGPAGSGRKELRGALEEVLLENAAGLYSGWARCLYTAACGYTARGEPAAPQGLQRVSVEG